MRLVTSIMTSHKLTEEEKIKIMKMFSSVYPHKMETFTYDYKENKYHEFDIDLFDVGFTKETIYQDINKLVSLYEKVMAAFPFVLDFIAGNDDTGSAVEIYENDWNAVESFGLFATSRKVANLKPYYSSDMCNAYLNFEYVSFGCMF
ncbi:hypothetical protein RA068_001644 [Listeria monocytogenes]|nr:hypothetical protein [Listeria monocytogenes]EKZ0872665.1 hypothetical protein [Listeria monocytogenes]